MIGWKKGPPAYGGELKDRAVWLAMGSRVCIGLIFARHEWPTMKNHDDYCARWLSWIGAGSVGDPPKGAPLVVRVIVQGASEMKLKDMQGHIYAHAEIETPALPERT